MKKHKGGTAKTTKAVKSYLKKTHGVRTGEELHKQRKLKRAFKNAVSKDFVRKQTSEEKRREYYTKKWRYAIKYVLRAVRAVRNIKRMKGGEFTPETLEPNLLRKKIAEYSYSTWAATYARNYVGKDLECDQTIKQSLDNIDTEVNTARSHARNSNAIGFQFRFEQVPPCYESIILLPSSARDEAKVELLTDFLKYLEYFEGMPHEVIGSFASAVRLTKKKKGEYIYKKGDEAENFYVVLSGTLSIILCQLGIDFTVTRIEKGGQFGEYDLDEGHKRQHDIMALTDCILLRIHKDDYHPILKEAHAMEMKKKMSIFQSMPIFSNASREELLQLANVADIKRYTENSIIAKEGHMAQFLYIVTDGDCQSVMKIKNDPGTIARMPHRAKRQLLLKVQDLGEGITFGETVLFDKEVPHGSSRPVLKYPASLIAPVYAEIMIIPRKRVAQGLNESTLSVLRELATESQRLYAKEENQRKYHQDNTWRRKKLKILKPLLSDAQFELSIKYDEYNMGLRPEKETRG